MMNVIREQWKTWVFHLSVAAVITGAFWLAGNPIYGAWAAAGGYTFREGQEIMDQSNPTMAQWIDHVGDLTGPYLVLVLASLVV